MSKGMHVHIRKQVLLAIENLHFLLARCLAQINISLSQRAPKNHR